VLVVARFAQGASAALVAPSALAVLTGMYREGPARTRALSIFQAATAGGATAGIVLGGLLTSYIGWRAIFLVNPPIIAMLAVALPRLLRRDVGQGRTRLDVAGAALISLSVTGLIYGLSVGEDHSFTTPSAIAAFALAVLLGGLFVRTERIGRRPHAPVRLLRRPCPPVDIPGGCRPHRRRRSDCPGPAPANRRPTTAGRQGRTCGDASRPRRCTVSPRHSRCHQARAS
jgi:MFS family permease